MMIKREKLYLDYTVQYAVYNSEIFFRNKRNWLVWFIIERKTIFNFSILDYRKSGVLGPWARLQVLYFLPMS